MKGETRDGCSSPTATSPFPTNRTFPSDNNSDDNTDYSTNNNNITNNSNKYKDKISNSNITPTAECNVLCNLTKSSAEHISIENKCLNLSTRSVSPISNQNPQLTIKPCEQISQIQTIKDSHHIPSLSIHKIQLQSLNKLENFSMKQPPQILDHQNDQINKIQQPKAKSSPPPSVPTSPTSPPHTPPTTIVNQPSTSPSSPHHDKGEAMAKKEDKEDVTQPHKVKKLISFLYMLNKNVCAKMYIGNNKQPLISFRIA